MDRENELISIIVAVYNSEPYLSICLDSIMNQTYKNLQIILVDDGSTDRSGIICDEYAEKDQRFMVIHKKNHGHSMAKNDGLKLAKGKWIAFADNDDWMETDHLEKLYNAAKKNDADISICGYINHFTDRKVKIEVPEKIYSDSREVMNDYFFKDNLRVVPWNKLYQKHVLQQIEFRDGVINEDEFFTYLVLEKADRIISCNNLTYNYRRHANNQISQRISKKNIRTFEAYFEKIDFLKKNYPELVPVVKYQTCQLSMHLYQRTIWNPKNDEKKRLKKMIKENRKKISFSSKELCAFSIQEKADILLSRYCLNSFSIIRNYLNLHW